MYKHVRCRIEYKIFLIKNARENETGVAGREYHYASRTHLKDGGFWKRTECETGAIELIFLFFQFFTFFIKND